jgi:hypothetical protein
LQHYVQLFREEFVDLEHEKFWCEALSLLLGKLKFILEKQDASALWLLCFFNWLILLAFMLLH